MKKKPTAADLAAIIKLEPADAVAYLKRKGFAIGWDWHSVSAQTHARAFTVAKAASFDILGDIRTGLVENMRQGKTVKDYIRDMQPTLEAKGWWGRKTVINPAGSEQEVTLGTPRRLETIYQTNMQSAYMAGRYKSALEATETHPYWMYVATMDGRTRPSHAALDGKVFRWDDPVWNHILPPNGYNCRCRFIALTAAEVERRGLTVESSEGKVHTETVETGVASDTGEINTAEVTILETRDRVGKKVLFRTDPGFNSSPANSHIMDDLLLKKAERAMGEPAALEQMQEVLLNPVRMKAWDAYVENAFKVGRPQSIMACGVMQQAEINFAKKLNKKVGSPLIFLRDGMIVGEKAKRHQLTKGDNLTRAELRALPLYLAQADYIVWDGKDELLYFFMMSDGTAIKAALRFGKMGYGAQKINDLATVFKVEQAVVHESLKKFIRVR